MNGKLIPTSKTFSETCAYVCQELSQAQVLYGEGVRTYSPKVMAEDFEWQHTLKPEAEKPVFHSVLTFPPGEKVKDERLVEIGKEYIQKMGLSETQYVFVKHSNTRHLHMHIVANWIDNHGRLIDDWWAFRWSADATRELTAKYGLEQEHGKRLDLMRFEAMRGPDIKRYQVYQAIQEVFPRCRGLDDLEKELLTKGITLRYRYDKETGAKQGVSFRYQNLSFKGSQVDNGCSLRKLQQRLAVQDLRRTVMGEDEQVARLKESLKPEVRGDKIEKSDEELRKELKEKTEKRKEQTKELVQEQKPELKLRRGPRISF
ncbi:MAG TPA: relaxase/mobilization nuclease domain-containing protein, partial [Puia sp.]